VHLHPCATPPVRLLVVDDNHLMRTGLELCLGLEPDIDVVGTAANGLAAVDTVARLAPDVVLMDLQMPVLDGLRSTRAVVGIAPATRVLVLTMDDEPAMAVKAFEAGARGYLLKDAGPDRLADSVRCVRADGTPIAQELWRAMEAQALTRSLGARRPCLR
jgi:DNA-binding NarL/FixJ family response regulator